MDDVERLATYVRERRNVLGLTQRAAAVAADMSNQTWVNIEAGKGASESKLYGVDRALRWEPGSAREVLHGGEPVPVGGAPGNQPTRVEQAILEDDTIPQQGKDALLAMIAALKSDVARR